MVVLVVMTFLRELVSGLAICTFAGGFILLEIAIFEIIGAMVKERGWR